MPSAVSTAKEAEPLRKDPAQKLDFTTITETPDARASQEQIERLYARYRFAAGYCRDKEVLEVACGAGIGLGCLARSAKKVVGGDIDENNLRFARQTYSGRPNIEITSLNAQELPFKDNSFDVVIFYEAIYYLPQPDRFLTEARRILRKDGTLIICTVNKDWSGFNPSPLSTRYFSGHELQALLVEQGFETELYVHSPEHTGSTKGKLVSAIKIAAVKLHLIPKTMKGKEALKRLFHGRLVAMPAEIGDFLKVDYFPPVPLMSTSTGTQYKVIFAVGRLSDPSKI